MKNSKTKQIALTALLTSQALALSYLESLIPAVSGFPPGAKPGFSNIAVMFSAQALSIPQTLFIIILKALFAGVTRGFTAFWMSLAGGILSGTAAIILFKTDRLKLGYIGIGMVCAVLHNLGQLCIASVILGTDSVFTGYGPFLMIASLITGFITGTILKYILPALNKQKDYIFRTNKKTGDQK